MVVKIDPDLIRRFKDQPRLEFDPVELLELEQSILKIGQRNPIDVYPIPPEQQNGDGCLYEIATAGERRWTVCKKLRRPVKALIRSNSKPNEVERFIRAFADNMHAVPHTTYEMVMGVIKLYNMFSDVTQIHEATGISVPTIYIYLKLRKLNPLLLDLMKQSVPEEKRLRLEHAKRLATEVADFDEQMAIYNDAYSQIGKGTKVVTRALNTLVAEACAASSRHGVAASKRDVKKDAARAVQALISSIDSLGKNEEGLKRHLLFVVEADRQEFENSLIEAQKLLPNMLKITRSLASG